MHPLDTDRRRRLLAASLRLERTLKRGKNDSARERKQPVARRQRGGRRWDDTPV